MVGIKDEDMSGGANGKWVAKIGGVGGPKLGGIRGYMLGGKNGAGLDRNKECLA